MSFAAYGQPHKPVHGPAVWDGEEIGQDACWDYVLPQQTIEEIKANLARTELANLPFKEIDATKFPLPSFVKMGGDIARQLGQGRGVAKLRGLDISAFDLPTARTVFCGLCAHIGITVSQSHRGDYIGDVMDFRDASDDRRYHNGGEFIMHRDPSADVSALLSMRKAKEGGFNRLMSAGLLHNVLLTEHPDLMDVAYRGFYYRRTTPDRGETALFTPQRIPAFDFSTEGEFTAHYIPHFSEYYLERDGISPDAAESRIHAIIRDIMWDRPELYYETLMEPGDIQLVSNRVALHSRTDYIDWPDVDHARLLLRVWLQLPNLAPVPPHMIYFENSDRAGGGISAARSAVARG